MSSPGEDRPSGRAWGEKARETKHTENLDNQQLLHLQRDMMNGMPIAWLIVHLTHQLHQHRHAMLLDPATQCTIYPCCCRVVVSCIA